MMKIVTFKSRSVPVYYPNELSASIEQLNHKLYELELDFDFRKKMEKN
jgi:hypothetical protein